MAAVTAADLVRMRDQLFTEGPHTKRKLTRFWMLLLLAAVIAAAGVVSDSTATVIGAMIVAPLMTPILGVVLAIVLADRVNLLRSAALVVLGAAAVVLLSYLLGLLVAVPVDAETSSQVAGRINPRLVDLVAALATGAVGSVALARSDISDTLPGVAIAISLVPPLAVVGLTLEAGAPSESMGAFLLFATNVAAILLSGIVVMAVYKVAARDQRPESHSRRRRMEALGLVLVAVVVLCVPLAATSSTIAQQSLDISSINDAASTWAEEEGWRVVEVTATDDGYDLVVAGAPPEPDLDQLEAELESAGVGDADITVELIPERRVELNRD